ncbi:CPXCG motif-containing cysteine-rich protein [Halomonas sp.]|uniref:CPXCG motif-containing cysteine-rich protein n=1 Tax=Halomonas sp. TaxID=1486246 RepID=UPI003561DD0E
MNEEDLQSRVVRCPYCDAAFDLLVDLSQGDHVTWEDCHWCCAPIQIRIDLPVDEDEPIQLTLGRDDDVL